MLLKKTFSRTLLLLILFSLLAFTRMGSLSAATAIPNVVDYTDHISLIIHARTALTEGQFPVKTALRDPQKWPYPIFQFYSPTTYTFAGAVYRWLTPQNPFLAFKLCIWLALTLGAFYFYRVIFSWIPQAPVAILASAAYLFAPYLILVINRWGAFPETLAIGLIPVVLFYSMRCLDEPESPYAFIGCTIAWFFLMTVHIITFVYTSLFIGLWMLGLAWRKRYTFRHLLGIATAYAYAYLLGLWFIAPVQLLWDTLLIKTGLTNPANLNSSTSLLSLLSNAYISPGLLANVFVPYNSPINPAIGWPVLLAVGVALYAVATHALQKTARDRLLLPLLLLFFLAFFMVWSPFDFWRWLPQPLSIAQFCFRLLTQVIWIGAFIFAWALTWLFKDKLDARHVVIGLFLLGMASSSWFPQLNRAPHLVPDLVKKPMLTLSHHSYLINPSALNNRASLYVDSLPLFIFMEHETWHLTTSHTLSTVLLMNSQQALVEVEGEMPKTTPKGAQLFALLNGKTVSTLALKPGKFKWHIPIGHAVLATHHPQFRLGFETKGLGKTPLLVEKVILSRVEPDLKLMPVDSTQRLCSYHASVTRCQITTTENTRWVELPVLYYPQMMDIRVNGEQAKVHGIVHDGYVLAAVDIPPHQSAVVTARFTGMAWANTVSILAWVLLAGLFLLGKQAKR